MAKEQNLTPFTSEQSRDEAVKNGRKGGIASGEARRNKRDIRMALEALLEKEYTDKAGNVMTGVEAIALKQMEKAMKGDTKAFEVVRDTVGQKPTERVDMNVGKSEKLDDIFSQLGGEGLEE